MIREPALEFVIVLLYVVADARKIRGDVHKKLFIGCFSFCGSQSTRKFTIKGLSDSPQGPNGLGFRLLYSIEDHRIEYPPSGGRYKIPIRHITQWEC